LVSSYSSFTYLHLTRYLALPIETASDLIKSVPSSDHIKSYLEIYASESHLAGSERDHALANYTRDQFEMFGLETEMETYYPLLSYPITRQLTLVNVTDEIYQASLSEDNRHALPTFHAYSANGNVTGTMVYVNYARVEDFMELSTRNISCQIALVRTGMVTRGAKVRNAQNFGCQAIVIYTDPEDEDASHKDDPQGSRQVCYTLSISLKKNKKNKKN
jgi:N-acetylated-alpha-linked acidic dipeptidase